MGVEDDLSEEDIRKMEAMLLGSEARKGTVVETRRSGRPKPDPVELRFADYLDDYDGEWIFTEVHQKASSG